MDAPVVDLTSLDYALAVADWRLRVARIYAAVRASEDPADAHAGWVAARDELFATHPASPILDQESFAGLDVAPYDPSMRFVVPVLPDEPRRMDVPTGTDGVVPFERLGRVELPGVGSLAVWALRSYGGGLFVPVRDALAGRPGGTYGGGRYLLDTSKSAHLGASDEGLMVDLNFAYNPSCAYDPAWACPLAQAENTVPVGLDVGERAKVRTA
ncbi:DUF1684 domain-containing protein [Cellulomonas sp. PhB150]|uniref:DUF1684 domain-containing protein n=1 Tax=Cellulomonas sp. PhB150 TaxID=2485188 RepID=UPI001F185708|nr:DUF1684 domain-containing protein [Cellulomonas sp. PhB150]